MAFSINRWRHKRRKCVCACVCLGRFETFHRLARAAGFWAAFGAQFWCAVSWPRLRKRRPSTLAARPARPQLETRRFARQIRKVAASREERKSETASERERERKRETESIISCANLSEKREILTPLTFCCHRRRRRRHHKSGGLSVCSFGLLRAASAKVWASRVKGCAHAR